jgi:hypothetical protein
VITLIMFRTPKIATLVFLPWCPGTEEIWRAPGSLDGGARLAVGTMLVSSHLQIAYYTVSPPIFLIVATVASLRAKEGGGS